MVPNIVFNNKTNIETLFQRITYVPNYKILISTWYNHTSLMSEEEFIIELDLLFFRLRNKSANKVVLNFTNFDFFISPTKVNNYISTFSDQINSLKIKKVAVLLPSNNMIKISIEQALDRIQMAGNFDYKNFSSINEALRWLKE